MSDEDLYDEFGNYIGPDLDDSSDEDDDDELRNDEDPVGASNHEADHQELALNVLHEDDEQMAEEEDEQQQIVLHEDKEHYASADQIFGEGVKTVVLDEDAMDLETTPILETSKKDEDDMLLLKDTSMEYQYSDDYLAVQLANETTRTRRGIAVVGALGHGKTSLLDCVLEPTLAMKQEDANSNSQKQQKQKHSLDRYTDTLSTERDRQMSLQNTALTCLLSDVRGKSYCITAIDTPGHVNFHDQACAAMRIVDGVVLVVDVVEGCTMHTEMLVNQAVSEGLSITLVMSKMDRLICELKLPPRDAYFKLQHVLDQVNDLIQKASRGRYPLLCPTRGNVAFSAATHGWIFTLESLAQVYVEQAGELGVPVPEFAQRLWGNAYWDPATKQFHKSASDCTTPHVSRTFCTFVLEPIYKIYASCLGAGTDCPALLRSIGVLLRKEELRQSAQPLLKLVMRKFLQSAQAGFTQMLVQHIPHPVAAAKAKVARCFGGPQTSPLAQAMRECSAQGPLVLHVVQTIGSQVLARIYSGTVRPQTPVQVLGESWSPEDTEDIASATIQGVSIPRGRKQTQASIVKAGNWVLLEGLNITKTATVVGTPALKPNSDGSEEELGIFKPLSFPQAGGHAIVKVSLEPLQPAQLPKMVAGLRQVSKTYPMTEIKVEESGEHVVFGTGELYMDCLLHDLRQSVEVKVADPLVAFRETAVELSSLKCVAQTSNQRNQLSMVAEPLDEGLAEQLEAGKVQWDWDTKKMGRFFQTNYNWDLLSSRSVWAFGDSPTKGTNLLLDDTLPSQVDKSLLNTCKSSIVQGFQWATREGPLCEEPVRGTKLKLLDVSLADKAIYRGGGQLIPAARRTVHSALLTATPRLMEPIYRLEIQCQASIVQAIQPVLTRRRGHIIQDRPIPGTTLATIKGFLPVLDSFGFETDLRTFTQGQAMVHSVFDHWSVVPGDPLDRSIILHPLEPSPPPHLARELLVKTRRRKGLSEDVSVSKFFDEAMKAQLAAQEEHGSDIYR